MDQQLFVAFLIDWEDNGAFTAIAAPDTLEEAKEAVIGALRNHDADTAGYVVPVTFAARGTLGGGEGDSTTDLG